CAPRLALRASIRSKHFARTREQLRYRLQILFTCTCGAGRIRYVIQHWILALILMAPMQVPPSRTLDESVPPGENYDKAEFRLWMPQGLSSVRAIVVLTPGSNGDGRPDVESTAWQEFATKNKVALVGCRFTDKRHDQSFIEEYVNVSRG